MMRVIMDLCGCDKIPRIEVIFNQVLTSTVYSGRQIYHGGGFIL